MSPTDTDRKRPFVSVVIPARNAEATIGKTLRALDHQSWPADRMEVIVVDNVSDDRTAEIVRRTGATLLVNDRRANPYLSRNIGAAQASGEVIVFLDASCKPARGWLEAGMALIAKGADLVGGRIEFRFDRRPGWGEWYDSITFADVQEYVEKLGAAAGGNLFVHRRVWQEMGPFSEWERSGEDLQWTRMASESGFAIAFGHKAVVRYPARDLAGTLKKLYRVGKGSVANWKREERTAGYMLTRTLATFLPPSPKRIASRIRRRGHRRMKPWMPLLWLLDWAGRIAMGLGRTAGLARRAGRPNRHRAAGSGPEQPLATIAFLYYRYYPVTGGASVHGANLARELHRLGYRLLKVNGEPDPWSEMRNKTPWGILAMLRESDLVYVRMDYFFNMRNLSAAVALLFGKPVVVELNCPSDERRLFGGSPRSIRLFDALYRRLLRRVRAVIVVSDGVRRYAEEGLGLQNVHLIENGGERFRPEEQCGSPSVRRRLQDLRGRYGKLAVWAGTPTRLQSRQWLTRMAALTGPETAILLLVNQKGARESVEVEAENVIILPDLHRQEVRYLIGESDIGLAFYEPAEWSRWGFYLSPLKIVEYLNNGLLTITNIEGTPIQRAAPGFRQVTSPEQAAEVIRGFHPDGSLRKLPPVRTWADVAAETAALFNFNTST